MDKNGKFISLLHSFRDKGKSVVVGISGASRHYGRIMEVESDYIMIETKKITGTKEYSKMYILIKDISYVMVYAKRKEG